MEGPRPPKCYKDLEFLNSKGARLIRIMCELEQPKQQLDAEGVENIVMFFGSARTKPPGKYEQALAESRTRMEQAPESEEAKEAFTQLQKQAPFVEYYQVVMDVASKVTEWSQERRKNGFAGYFVGTGGGAGITSAANEGAMRAGGKSVAFGISPPSQDGFNPYVTPELSMEFHYFFTRKYWMAYRCMGLVVAPGGLGTCDLLFELLTLMQTFKIRRKLPVILIGSAFWKGCINWQSFVDHGMIASADKDQLHFCDTAEEVMNALTAGIEQLETDLLTLKPKKKN